MRRGADPILLPAPAGASVIQVTATDADDATYGNSARVVYSILEGQPYFSVDPETGLRLPAPDRAAFRTALRSGASATASSLVRTASRRRFCLLGREHQLSSRTFEETSTTH